MIANYSRAKDAQSKPIHAVNMMSRSKMDISGVKEVVSFDAESAVIDTVEGTMVREGSGIKIGELNVSSGCVTLSGRVDAIYYTVDTQEKKRSVFGRLFK